MLSCRKEAPYAAPGKAEDQPQKAELGCLFDKTVAVIAGRDSRPLQVFGSNDESHGDYIIILQGGC